MITVTMPAQTTARVWLNPPSHWSETGDTLTETVPSATDYWRVTHYGFIRDNAPFRYQEQSGILKLRFGSGENTTSSIIRLA